MILVKFIFIILINFTYIVRCRMENNLLNYIAIKNYSELKISLFELDWKMVPTNWTDMNWPFFKTILFLN